LEDQVIATAKLKYLGVSSQKTRLVIDQLRNKPVGDALTILHFSQKLVARPLEKLLKSAVANAEVKDPEVDMDDLVVVHAVVDEAPPLKRSRHRAMGRVFRILKRSCHVTIGLDIPLKRG
jgi:large subunit ribosomal protein L22